MILTIVGLSTKERYLLNENVIYGLNFSQPAKDLGFKNGDKIVSINDKEIVEFNEILEDMLYAYGDVKVGIVRENYDKAIVLSNKEIFGLIKEGTTSFMPRLNADTVFNTQRKKKEFFKITFIFPNDCKTSF